MASTSSRSSARGRDKDKAVRGGAAGRDIPEALVRPTRASRLPSQLQPPVQLHITNNYFDNVRINGTMFGGAANEDPEQSRRSPRTTRARPNAMDAASIIQMARGAVPNQADEADAELGDDESDREYSYGEGPGRPPFQTEAITTTQERVQDWRRDSGYVGSTRRSKGGRNEAYRASEKDGSTNASLRGNSTHRKRKNKAQSVEPSELDAEASTASEENQRSLRAQRDTEGDGEGDNDEDTADDSGDDFARRHMQVATEDNKQIKVRVMLDTGTKPNWISYHFLTDKLGKKYNSKLNDEEDIEYTDMSGNNFSPIGKVEIMVYSADFSTEKGSFPCRILSFMVIKRSNIKILLGRETVKKENLLRMPPASQNSKAYPAVLSNPKKSERAVIAQNKEKQNKEGAERDKIRQDAAKAKAKEKKEAKSSNSSTAMLAQESTPRRRRGSPPPPRDPKQQVSNNNSSWKKTKQPLHERSSSASSSAGGAALSD